MDELIAEHNSITLGELKAFIREMSKKMSDDAIIRLGYKYENKDKTLSYFENNVISVAFDRVDNSLIFYNYD